MCAYLNKIGEYSLPVCSVRPNGVQQVAVAYTYNLGEGSGPDGEGLWDVEHYADFTCHAMWPYLHHKLEREHTSCLLLFRSEERRVGKECRL